MHDRAAPLGGHQQDLCRRLPMRPALFGGGQGSDILAGPGAASSAAGGLAGESDHRMVATSRWSKVAALGARKSLGGLQGVLAIQLVGSHAGPPARRPNKRTSRDVRPGT